MLADNASTIYISDDESTIYISDDDDGQAQLNNEQNQEDDHQMSPLDEYQAFDCIVLLLLMNVYFIFMILANGLNLTGIEISFE